MPFQIVIDVNDDKSLRLRAPVPPAVTAAILAEAYQSVQAQVVAAMVLAQLDHQRRVELAPANALTRLGNGNPPV